MAQESLALKPALSTTTLKVLEANTRRSSALFVNNDGAIVIYLSRIAPAVISESPIRLNAGGGNYEINGSNPWYGEIHAIAASGTPVLLIDEVSGHAP